MNNHMTKFIHLIVIGVDYHMFLIIHCSRTIAFRNYCISELIHSEWIPCEDTSFLTAPNTYYIIDYYSVLAVIKI